MMRGQNYDIDLKEFEEYSEDLIDYEYFLMFDKDQSLEVTWDEYCLGTSKMYKMFYFTEDDHWFGISATDFATATNYDPLSVRHYDYDNDGFIAEYEWVMAEIRLNEFQYYANADLIETTDLTAAGWEDNLVTLFDVQQST